MRLDLPQEMAIATVIKVESLPCEMVGQKQLLSITGEAETGNLKLPWRWQATATWLDDQLAANVKEILDEKILFGVAMLADPEEPDQIVTVMIDNHTKRLSTAYKEIFQKALKAAIEEIPAAIVTILNTQGSSHKPGAKMIIYRDGQLYGSIGDSSVESEIRLAAFNVIDKNKPHIYKASVTADNTALKGMAYGDSLEVFIEPVNTITQAFGELSSL